VQGVKIPFDKKPIQLVVPSVPHLDSIEDSRMSIAIKDLICKGAIQKCSPHKDQFISSYFLVPKKNGDYRFVINLKKLNEFIEPPHFKLTDVRTVIQLVRKDSFMATMDLKDAYYLIPISEECKKFIRFQWKNDIYEFNCLPFGLNISPYIFTKVLKVAMTHLRTLGLTSIDYLDDLIFIEESKHKCEDNIKMTREVLENLGFLINDQKSQLIPSQSVKYLGFIINSSAYNISISTEKRQNISINIEKFLSLTRCTIREFAQLIGQLISVRYAIPYSILYTKIMEREKIKALRKSNNNFDETMEIHNDVKIDLAWWQVKIQFGKCEIRNDTYCKTIFSDASTTGWGAYCENVSTGGLWSASERMWHINHLELIAAFHALKSFTQDVNDCQILFRIDNTTAISYINKMGGTRHKTLSQISREFWQYCESKKLWILATYISSKENYVADRESRVQNFEHEWELNDSYFNLVIEHFGYPEVDLFASNINTKCNKFVSWRPCPGAMAVDAFTISWSKIKFYAFPPFIVIARVIKKIIDDNAHGILVVPQWPSQPWFPEFTKLICGKPLIFEPNHELLQSVLRDCHPLSKQLTLVAALLSSTPSEKTTYLKKVQSCY